MQKDRRQIILEYIRKNEGCTKQKVIDYMNGSAVEGRCRVPSAH